MTAQHGVKIEARRLSPAPFVPTAHGANERTVIFVRRMKYTNALASWIFPLLVCGVLACNNGNGASDTDLINNPASTKPMTAEDSAR
ncbi:MAG TPA: hypothetical protein VEY71_00860, partial [Chitinophagales bacterium]|nr:hypothetical protein [Chitinophagales bacterium]